MKVKTNFEESGTFIKDFLLVRTDFNTYRTVDRLSK